MLCSCFASLQSVCSHLHDQSKLTSHNCDVPIQLSLNCPLQAVQIDPDAEAGETDSKSAAAALCGGPPKADKPFDF
jgi:hypothetical protein